MKRILIVVMSLLIGEAMFSQKLMTRSGEIKFDASMPDLVEIAGTNSGASCIFDEKTGEFVALALVKSFKFKSPLMEEHFNENYMESSKYPKSIFKGTITNLKQINFNKDGSYPTTVSGKLTIHDVTKEAEATGTVEVKGGKIIARTKFNINLKDYGIGGAMIGKKIAETIAITVDCQYE